MQAKVTSKGQITLPKALRRSLGIMEGDQVEFSMEAPAQAKLRKLSAAGSSAGVLKCLAKDKPLSVEAMDQAIRESAGKRARAERNR